MKAIVIDGYGGSERLETRELPDPAPGPGEVLVRVHAASVNPVDWKIRRGDLRPIMRLKFPYIPGSDIAGEVVAVGPGVTRFKPGDAVVAYLELKRGGGYAELAAAKESAVALKSHALDFAEAASLPIAAVTALQGLRDVGELREGASVLINGAAGGVGHFGVQIARSLGAVTTATCGPSNVDFVRSLGADHVIDYSQQDFTQLTGRYDVIFDAAAKSRFGACRRLLKPGGTFVTTMPSPGLIFMYPLQWVIGLYENVKKGRFVIARPDGAELAFLGALAEKGRLRPTVSLKLPLADAGKAHDASEGGHTRGKIVLETYRGASLTVSADE